MLFSLPGKPILTPEQVDRLANILDNAGQVFLGVLVLTPLVQGIDKTNIGLLALGVVDVLVCWTASIRLARRKEQ
jgi:hypothetical protein